MTIHPYPILTFDTCERNELLELTACQPRVLQVALLPAKRVTDYGCSSTQR